MTRLAVLRGPGFAALLTVFAAGPVLGGCSGVCPPVELGPVGDAPAS